MNNCVFSVSLQIESPLPNVNEISYFLEQAGVALGCREEIQRIFLALKQLVDSQPLQRCRLWGKILGTESHYIVAEAEYREGDEEEDLSPEDAPENGDADVDDEKEGAEEVSMSCFSFLVLLFLFQL